MIIHTNWPHQEECTAYITCPLLVIWTMTSIPVRRDVANVPLDNTPLILQNKSWCEYHCGTFFKKKLKFNLWIVTYESTKWRCEHLSTEIATNAKTLYQANHSLAMTPHYCVLLKSFLISLTHAQSHTETLQFPLWPENKHVLNKCLFAGTLADITTVAKNVFARSCKMQHNGTESRI